jgi:L-fuconolactonase
MIQFPIVDTHVHLWDPSYLRYPWLDGNALLNKPYLLADYRRACGPVQVEKMVFLQCECDFSQFQQEADWVTSLAQQDPRLQGIVPWAPLEKGDAARPALAKLAENRLIKGVRRIIQFEPDIEFCLQPDFVKGVQALVDYNFSFDICIFHPQLANKEPFAGPVARRNQTTGRPVQRLVQSLRPGHRGGSPTLDRG